MFSRLIQRFKDPQSSDRDINLLLLGETGVGKSTFINSISNYFKYEKFNYARKGKIQVLIPVHLNDVSNNSKICGDPDQDEKHESGASATQYVKVYLLPIKMDGKMFNLRIIDTPGVGDPRGINQDNIHIDNILAYLATLKTLHGICYVMKSNNSRLTTFIEYCLMQILTRLDKSASNNIIFITTYSKTAQYTAGETKFHCLEPVVKNIRAKPPHVNIPLSDQNVFSLDNEGFKAILEMQAGKQFEKHDINSFAKSWITSVKECRRLLTYIIGDAKTSPLIPHEVKSTISVNEVRFLVEQLAIPIAEIAELIQDNLRLLDRHKKNLNFEDQTLTQLKQHLFIPCVDLEVTVLDQPVTVCTSAENNCAEIVKINDVTKWHYTKKCHEPCHLRGIPKEMIGDPGLVKCAAMSGQETCIKCNCNWRVHMHIYKNTEKVTVQKEDTNVKDVIKNKEDVRVRIENLMQILNQRKLDLESEGNIISESIAKFSYFLQEHALTPFNDAYSDYIKHLIKNEQHLGKFADPTVIENLTKLLDKHDHLQKTFQQGAQKCQAISGESYLTPQAIKKSISDLYNLKYMGKKIKELIKKSTACKNKETQTNFKCIISQEIDLNSAKINVETDITDEKNNEYYDDYNSLYHGDRTETYYTASSNDPSRLQYVGKWSKISEHDNQKTERPGGEFVRSSGLRKDPETENSGHSASAASEHFYASKHCSSRFENVKSPPRSQYEARHNYNWRSERSSTNDKPENSWRNQRELEGYKPLKLTRKVESMHRSEENISRRQESSGKYMNLSRNINFRKFNDDNNSVAPYKNKSFYAVEIIRQSSSTRSSTKTNRNCESKEKHHSDDSDSDSEESERN